MDDDDPLPARPGPRRLRWILGLAVLGMALLLAGGAGLAPMLPVHELGLLCGGVAAAASYGQLRRPRDPEAAQLLLARAIPARARQHVDMAA